MNIVHLIGNGFDLNLGLKTGFGDFYKYYFEARKDDDRGYIQSFIKAIHAKKYENWADLELALGQHLVSFKESEADRYIDLWDDICAALAEYICQQEKQSNDVYLSQTTMSEGANYLSSPDSYIKEKPAMQFRALRTRLNVGHPRIDVLNFNYTKSFESIYGTGNGLLLNGSRLNSVIHVHGTTDEDMILGVNDSSQLVHDRLKSHNGIMNRLIKPTANENTQTMRAETCTGYIKEANIICIFGMSLGASDRVWWNAIAERLKNPDARLIIYARGDIDRRLSYLTIESQNKKIEDFLSAADVKDGDRKIIRDKISVQFDSKIFGRFKDLSLKKRM